MTPSPRYAAAIFTPRRAAVPLAAYYSHRRKVDFLTRTAERRSASRAGRDYMPLPPALQIEPPRPLSAARRV